MALAAWLPSIQPYIAAAEDFGRQSLESPTASRLWEWFLRHSTDEGLWRVVGLPFTDFARSLHPLGFSVLSLGTHTVNGLLLFLLLRRLRVGVILAKTAALLFVVLPSAVEAHMYAVASQSVQATTVFLLLALYLTIVIERDRLSPLAVGISFAAAFLGNAIQENLIFAFVVLPAAIAHVKVPLRSWPRPMQIAVVCHSAAIAAAIFLYGLTTIVLRTSPTKEMSINPETLLSFPLYQYTNFTPFLVWMHRDLIALVLEHHGWLMKLGSLALLIAGCVLARGMLTSAPLTDRDTIVRQRRLLESIAVLWMAAGLVFVAGGGYSFESRKKYVTLCFLAVIVAYVADRLISVASTSGRRRAITWTIAAIGAAAITTWVVSSLWILEARRGAAVVATLVAHPEIHEVEVQFVPSVQQQWPEWRYLASSQHSSPWVTSYEMSHRYNRRVDVGHEGNLSGATVIECGWEAEGTAVCRVVPSRSPE